MENQEKYKAETGNKKEIKSPQEKSTTQEEEEQTINEILKNPDEKRKLEKEINKDMLANSGLGGGPNIGEE